MLNLLPANPPAVGVGDAKGLDALVAEHYAEKTDLTIYHVEGRKRWQFAARSQRMINDATELIAFPNKPCPETCTPTKPFSGHGREPGNDRLCNQKRAKGDNLPSRR